MDKPSNTFLTDEQIEPELLKLIREAQEWVLLVSPYLKLWGHIKDAIRLATTRGVKVQVLVRAEEKQVFGEDVTWLMQNGVDVLATQSLHAKIYISERATMISSMNLTESSTNNAREIGLVVGDEAVMREIQRYIRERVAPLAYSLGNLVDANVARSVPEPSSAGTLIGVGFCIRCGGRIAFDRDRPLCEGDYETWAKRRNPDYEESCCHSCGRPDATTYARPLCYECYQRLR